MTPQDRDRIEGWANPTAHDEEGEALTSGGSMRVNIVYGDDWTPRAAEGWTEDEVEVE